MPMGSAPKSICPPGGGWWWWWGGGGGGGVVANNCIFCQLIVFWS